HVTDLVLHPLADARRFEEARAGRHVLREAEHPGAKRVEPEREPRALEPCIAGQKHALAAPERRVHFHIFHRARPVAQTSSRRFLARKVAMGCQKPRWKYAASDRCLARLSSGSRSHTVASPSIRSSTSGESTKKPPLIQPPSPLGFSWKLVTSVSSSTSAPKRPGGCTAVSVALTVLER